MNIHLTTTNDNTNRIKQWILSHLREECNIDCITLESPLIEQLDSFQTVAFLVACDEEFPSLKLSDMDSFNGLNIEGIADVIANKISSDSSNNY